MPAVVAGTPQKKNEAMWEALKTHIMRERQRKKQEQEADAEVERQRKERERQQKQDVMTLGETREQIQHLETRLSHLKDEKHQLFLQLKKVLNEDDNRRRQLVKASNEILDVHSYSAVTLIQHPPVFLQQNLPLGGHPPLFKVAPTHGGQRSFVTPQELKSGMKRLRSPSPPAPNYHQGYGYKPTTIPAYSQQKVDDGRRGHEYVRAVLWNKNAQYASSQPFYAPHAPATTVGAYSTPSQAAVYTYAPAAAPQYAAPPSASAAASAAAPPPPSREDAAPKPSQQQSQQQQQPPLSVFMGQPRTNLTALPPHSQTYVTAMHQPMEHSVQKQSFQSQQEAAEKYYAVSASRPAGHVPVHGGAIPIQQPPQGAKTGGITSGYPIRAPPVAAPHATTGSYQPSASTPHSVYVTQAPSGRLMFSQTHQPPTHPAAHQPPHQGRYPVSGMTREV